MALALHEITGIAELGTAVTEFRQRFTVATTDNGELPPGDDPMGRLWLKSRWQPGFMKAPSGKSPVVQGCIREASRSLAGVPMDENDPGKKAAGSIEEATGTITGGAPLRTEGKAEKRAAEKSALVKLGQARNRSL